MPLRGQLKSLSGERLSRDEYIADFERRFWTIDAEDFWKLERRQTFQEPGDASWEASTRDDWDTALRLIEERRASLVKEEARIAQAGFTTYRVRVVEQPITPYLRWELASLRLQNELGEHIKIVTGEQVAWAEHVNPLPEIVTIGTSAVYEVLYDDDGVGIGAIRSEDTDDIDRWRNLIQGQYYVGQDIETFLNSGAGSYR